MTPTGTKATAAHSAWRRWKSRYALGAAVLVAVAGGGVWLVLGRSDDERAQAVLLRDQIQLTSTGHVQAPAISQDGRQLAYVTRDCASDSCVYAVDIQDVGGSATRRLMDGAAGIVAIEWSADRRNLLVTGIIGNRAGSFLQPLLGGPPQPLPSLASFWSRGDSLLLTSLDIRSKTTSALWVGISGLDGVPSDSIRIPDAGRRVDAVAVPHSRWFLITARTAPANIQSLRLVDRHGREGDRMTGMPPLASRVIASSDAAWVSSYTGNTPFLVRIPLDPSSGRFGTRRDTIYAGQYSGSSVTADGSKLVVTQGSYEYQIWALDFADLMGGRFPANRRLVRSTTPVSALISPDGRRILITRFSTPGQARSSVIPFGGGSERELDLGGAWPAGWADSVSVVLNGQEAGAAQFSLRDVRSGARKNVLTIADSNVVALTNLPRGGWAWIPEDGASIRLRSAVDSTRSSIALPQWYGWASDVRAAPDGEHLGYIGYDVTIDSARFSVASLEDGSTTPWSTFGVTGDIAFQWLPNGSALLSMWSARDSVTVYRLREPDRPEKVGVIPRSIQGWNASNDLRRAAVTTSEFRGDAWMSTVVRPAP